MIHETEISKINWKKHKIDIRSKIQKMDIQDAEFEESPDE